jgi:hypothetical protein
MILVSTSRYHTIVFRTFGYATIAIRIFGYDTYSILKYRAILGKGAQHTSWGRSPSDPNPIEYNLNIWTQTATSDICLHAHNWECLFVLDPCELVLILLSYSRCPWLAQWCPLLSLTPFFKMGIGFQNLLIIISWAIHCTNKFCDFSQCSLVSMEYNCEGPMENIAQLCS